MRLISDSHLHGETIIKQDFPDEYESLSSVLAGMDVPLRPSEPFTASGRPTTPKRQRKKIGGADRYVLMPVDQEGLNKVIDTALRPTWNAQPLAGGGLSPGDTNLGLAGDFARNGVFVEVEFGNSASMFRDLFKFQIASRSGLGEAAVLVVATARLARFFDQGVTTFEQAVALKPYLAIGIQMPIWIVGLEPEDFDRIARHYAAMQEVAEANGVACHSYELANGGGGGD